MSDKEKKFKKIIAISKFIVLILFLVALPLILYVNNKEVIQSLESIDDFVTFINSYGNKAMFITFIIQLVQTIISVIPGQIIDMGAAYFFGAVPAFLLSISGVLIGVTIDYYIGKTLGRDFLDVVFKKEKVDNYIKLLNSKKGLIACFVVYLIPGYPKDIFNYVCGISEMKFKGFITVSTLGRFPGIIGSILMGRMVLNSNYLAFILIGVGAGILLLLAIIFREKIFIFLLKEK